VTRVLSVDLGATSVRVAEVDVDHPTREPIIVHRSANRPSRGRDGILRWDWAALMQAIRDGIAAAQARPSDEPIASLGVDTWGVDYGLLDAAGQLIAAPISYRDERTRGWRSISDRIGPLSLFTRTGVEPAPINTIFQLAAHDPDELGATAQLLMLPELVIHELTGAVLGERTSAGTSGLIDLQTGDWSPSLLAEAGIALDVSRFPTVQNAGAEAGATGGIPVTLVHGHDTASAVASLGVPSRVRAFVSTGSWLIIGTETRLAVVTEAAFHAGLTNERGPRGNLLARNIAGFVIVERLLAAWGRPDLGSLLAQAAAASWRGEPPAIEALSATENEEELLAVLTAASGQGSPGEAELLRIALAALARATAQTVRALADVTGIEFAEIAVMGGGVRTALFIELLEREIGLPVVVGVAEAAALGNALVQARARGLIGSD
jgi:rhamnulokinase